MEYKPYHAEYEPGLAHSDDSADEEDTVTWVTSDEWQGVFSEELWDFYAVLVESLDHSVVSLTDVADFAMVGARPPALAGSVATWLASLPGTWRFRDELWRLSDPVELQGFVERHSISSSS